MTVPCGCLSSAGAALVTSTACPLANDTEDDDLVIEQGGVKIVVDADSARP